jgi:hypothetical protein
MKARADKVVLATLVGVPVDTLNGWLAGDAIPPGHVRIAPSLIETARAARCAMPAQPLSVAPRR